MEYQVLACNIARTFKTWLTTSILRMLTNALQQQRIHHAYLFTGTRGVGKPRSRIIAKCLNCEPALPPHQRCMRRLPRRGRRPIFGFI